MKHERVKSGTAITLSVAFKDEDRNPASPTSVHLTVINRTTGLIVAQEEDVPSPAATMSIHIPSTANTLQNPALPFEVRRAKVRAVYGSDDEFVTTYDYTVENAN